MSDGIDAAFEQMEGQVARTDVSPRFQWVDHTTDVNGCARCGCAHESVTFRPLMRPIKTPSSELLFTHWAPCPMSREPILMAFVEEP